MNRRPYYASTGERINVGRMHSDDACRARDLRAEGNEEELAEFLTSCLSFYGTKIVLPTKATA